MSNLYVNNFGLNILEYCDKELELDNNYTFSNKDIPPYMVACLEWYDGPLSAIYQIRGKYMYWALIDKNAEWDVGVIIHDIGYDYSSFENKTIYDVLDMCKYTKDIYIWVENINTNLKKFYKVSSIEHLKLHEFV